MTARRTTTRCSVTSIPERRERGAAVMELAVILPVLMLLFLGVAEFGDLYHDRLVVQTAARSGARVGSGLGQTPTADFHILKNVKAAMNDITVNDLLKVVVFKSETPNGEPFADCLTAAPPGIAGKCNVYSGPSLLGLTESDFSCAATSPSQMWCPESRSNNLDTGDIDYVGVFVRVRRSSNTKMFGRAQSVIEDKAVMRIEPLRAEI